MLPKHVKILDELDAKGRKQHCFLPKRNFVGFIRARLNSHRLIVAVTRVSRVTFYAHTIYNGERHTWSGHTPSLAITGLGQMLVSLNS